MAHQAVLTATINFYAKGWI